MRNLQRLEDERHAEAKRTADSEALIQTVAYLLDAVKWHLRGAEGTDQRSLDERQFTDRSRG